MGEMPHDENSLQNTLRVTKQHKHIHDVRSGPCLQSQQLGRQRLGGVWLEARSGEKTVRYHLHQQVGSGGSCLWS
jgi:hypothetical protein